MLPAATIAGLALATLSLWSGVAHAAAGDLDPTFDGDGKRILPFPGIPTQTLVQPDGKIVLAGYNPNGNFAVWRLHPDGSLDRGFDGDGSAAADLGGIDLGYAAALQADGKIVVVGSTQSQQNRVQAAVARFTSQGELDPEFDPGGADGPGKKVFDDEYQTVGTTVLVQPDGKLVIGGSGGGARAFELRRLESDGTPDGTTFEPVGHPSSATAVALQADGKLVVTGRVLLANEQTWTSVIARYESGGSLDRTFAGSGEKLLGPDTVFTAGKVLVRPDGRLLVLGSGDPADPKIVVLRLTREGEVDGTTTPDFDGQDHPAAIALQSDGKVLVVGTTLADTSFAIARLDAAGSLDGSFGAAGRTTVSLSPKSMATAAALQSDGKLVVAGLAIDGDAMNLGVARLLPDPPPASGGPQAGPSTPPTVTRRCAGRRATIVGTNRSETLRGTRRRDVIVALGGNDRVLALGGNDLVCGGRGRDRLIGGAGRDRLIGGPGRDRTTQ